eukprot:139054-Prymnesium_polylepis.1
MESCWKLKLGAPPAPACVIRLTSELDSCTATVVGRAGIESPGRGVAARAHTRCPRVRSPKGPYPVRYNLTEVRYGLCPALAPSSSN